MLQNNQYLIISQSGRALAASAKCAGIDTHVIDLFADEDTAELALSNTSVTGFSGGSNPETLIELIAKYESNNANLSVVIGSGFEECPEILRQLEQRFSVIGNHSSVVRQLKEPTIFFKKLEELALPYPEYITDVNQAFSRAFLIKSIGGAGGGHIRHFKNHNSLAPGTYLQALLSGKNYSATFIADGKSFHLLGINETWVSMEYSDFTFAGALSNVSLPNELCQQLTDAIRRIVVLFKLKGLCGLDFIVEESGNYSILEVNPRPTATFELYETQGSLFPRHIAAFHGEMTKPELDQNLSRALGLLYAGKSITIPRLDWPDWVADRPIAGREIVEGEPICRVQAEASDLQSVKALLESRCVQLKAESGF